MESKWRCRQAVGQLRRSAAVDPDENTILFQSDPDFTGTVRFRYAVKDDTGGEFEEEVRVRVVAAGSDRSVAEEVIGVTGVNDPPTIDGADTIAINDQETASPFAGVTIADVDGGGGQRLEVLVALDEAMHGMLTHLGGFAEVPPGSGVYAFVGTAAEATAAIRGLIYEPVENWIMVDATEPTGFTMSVDDGFVKEPVTDTSTVVEVMAVNDGPTIGGTVAGLTVYERGAVHPFAGVTIGEVDDHEGQVLSVLVRLSDASNGLLAESGGFGDEGGGVYSFTGTASEATAALRSMLFRPTTGDRLDPAKTPPQPSEETRLTIAVDDGFGGPAIDERRPRCGRFRL